MGSHVQFSSSPVTGQTPSHRHPTISYWGLVLMMFLIVVLGEKSPHTRKNTPARLLIRLMASKEQIIRNQGFLQNEKAF